MGLWSRVKKTVSKPIKKATSTISDIGGDITETVKTTTKEVRSTVITQAPNLDQLAKTVTKGAEVAYEGAIDTRDYVGGTAAKLSDDLQDIGGDVAKGYSKILYVAAGLAALVVVGLVISRKEIASTAKTVGTGGMA